MFLFLPFSFFLETFSYEAKNSETFVYLCDVCNSLFLTRGSQACGVSLRRGFFSFGHRGPSPACRLWLVRCASTHSVQHRTELGRKSRFNNLGPISRLKNSHNTTRAFSVQWGVELWRHGRLVMSWIGRRRMSQCNDLAVSFTLEYVNTLLFFLPFGCMQRNSALAT